MRWQKVCLISIFMVALGLRLVLSLINRQANDNHLEPISWILDKHELPHKDDCWECFQPKGYYLLNLAIIKTFGVERKSRQIMTMQLVNFVFSFFILLLCWKFINRLNITASLKLAAFAFVALNPELAAINAQATNDTLEILGGVGTIYFAVLFFESKSLRDTTWMSAFVILACIVKASGLVLAFSIGLIFLLKFLFSSKPARHALLRPFFIFLFSFFLIVPFAGGYLQNYKEYNTPFVVNIPKADSSLTFYREVESFRPGITSFTHGFLTFRIVDMLKQPYIQGGVSPYVAHRTSLWSQLYGRTFFLHFDQHPKAWASLNKTLIKAGRAMLALALVPLAFFLLGYWQGMFRTAKNFFLRKADYFINETEWLHVVFSTVFFLFIIKYTADYRDFSTMKSIFVFPAIPSFIALFINGMSKVKSLVVRNIFFGLIAVLTAFSIYDISFLVNQLW
jgi:hypothetical protein